MKIGITCPLYINNWNHQDFLNKTTESIQTSHEWLWIPIYNYVAEQFSPCIWHFTQPPAEMHPVPGRQPQAVAKAWNDGIAKAITLGCEYVLVINADIVLKSTAIDNLVTFAENHKEAILWSMEEYHDLFSLEQAKDDPNDYHEHPNFSSFMVHKTWPQEFGLFDENFVPAYCEDNDTRTRFVFANKKAYCAGAAQFFHFGSRTANSDEEFQLALIPMVEKGAAYWRDKWGWGILREIDQMRAYYYRYPYDIEELALNEYIPDYWEFLAQHGVDSVQTLDKQLVLDYLREKGLR